MTDFSVRVKKLPHIDSFDAFNTLAADLTLHIKKIVKEKDDLSSDEEKQQRLKYGNLHFDPETFDPE